jgi:hypothetical protein
MPVPGHLLSVADAYFLEELQAAVGHRQASNWLLRTLARAGQCAHQGSSSSSDSSTPRQQRHDDAAAGAPNSDSLPCSPIRPADRPENPQSPADAPAASEDAERIKLELKREMSFVQRVLRGGGRDAGLMFTDAAHRVCDVGARPSA